MELQIRRRRMEKLAGNSNTKSVAPAGPENSAPEAIEAPEAQVKTESAEPASKPKNNITKKASQSGSEENPFGKLGIQSANTDTSPPVSTSDKKLAKRSRAESDEQNTMRPPSKISTAGNDESVEAYESRMLAQIFRITLNPGEKTDTSNHKLIYLPELRQERENDNADVRLSVATLDTALLEAAATISHDKSVLDYLLPCWKRVVRAFKGLRGYASAKDTVLKEARRLCMSNIVFATEMPEIFQSVYHDGTVELC